MADKSVRVFSQGDHADVKLVDIGAGTYAVAVTGAAGAPVPTQVLPTSGAPTDRSGTIAAGGTAQQLAAANANRRYLFIQNLSSGPLWFSSIATAVQSQPSIRLGPGDSYENPAHFCPTGAISIIGATTGQAYTAREG